MKKSFTTVLLIVLAFVSVKAQEKENIPSNQKWVGLELAKSLFWFMKDGGIVLEPEFGYQHKEMMYTAAIGYSSITDKIYNSLDYKNNGSHLKLGVGVQFNYNKDVVRNNIVVFGANLVFSNFTESATAYSDNSSYGGYGYGGQFIYTVGQKLEQQQSARGIETYFIYRRNFDNNFYAAISPQLNVILSELNSEEFPIYYVPGFGQINNDDGYGSNSPSGELGEGGAFAISIKLGYRF